MKAIGLVLCVVTGCSFAVTRSRPDASGACAGLLPAIVDGVVTGTLATLAVMSYRKYHCDGPDGCHNYDPTGLYVLPAIGFGASGVWGVSGARTCSRAAASR